MPGLQLNKSCIIHDSGDIHVTEMIMLLTDLTETHTIDIRSVTLDKWKTELDGMNNSKVALIVTLDSEIFHREIKQKLVEIMDREILLVIVYDDNMRHLADGTIKSIRKDRKRVRDTTSVQTNDNLNIAKAKKGEITNDIWGWLPHLLYIVSPINQNKRQIRRGVCVFYKINANNEVELDWYHQQKAVLEGHFHVSCEYSDPQDCADKDFVENSNCVVMYVTTEQLQLSNTLRDDQKLVIDTVNDNPLIVYFEKIHLSFDKVMMNRYKSRLAGQGSVIYCLELLSKLGIVRIDRRPDMVFYSTKHSDDNHLEFYQPSLERANTVLSSTNKPADARDTGEEDINLMDSRHGPGSGPGLPHPHRSNTVTRAVYVPREQYSGTGQVIQDVEQIERTGCWTCMKRVFPSRI